jgi:hypothetical protein
MALYFTKIHIAGDEHILITDNTHFVKPVLLLNRNEIKDLNKEWLKN